MADYSKLTVNILKQQVGRVPLISVDSRLIPWCLFIVAIKVEREAAGRRSQSNMKKFEIYSQIQSFYWDFKT